MFLYRLKLSLADFGDEVARRRARASRSVKTRPTMTPPGTGATTLFLFEMSHVRPGAEGSRNAIP